jgi:hypothetical protein
MGRILGVLPVAPLLRAAPARRNMRSGPLHRIEVTNRKNSPTMYWLVLKTILDARKHGAAMSHPLMLDNRATNRWALTARGTPAGSFLASPLQVANADCALHESSRTIRPHCRTRVESIQSPSAKHRRLPCGIERPFKRIKTAARAAQC